MSILISAFESAMNLTTTSNGALSYSTPDLDKQSDGRLSLFFKTIRGISDEYLIEYINKALIEDVNDTFLLAFNSRDPRGGKGERTIGRKMFEYLWLNQPEKFKKVAHLIPEYGRWDDLLSFFPKEDYIVSLFCEKLKEDKQLMNEGKPISLCSKWAPSEGDSDDKKYGLVNLICDKLGISKREYRKDYISPLREYLDIVERYMCAKRWYEIEYSKVPSCAMKKLKKAFERNAPEAFNEWTSKLEKGEVKVNAKVLHPHELIRELRTKGPDTVLESQWKVIEDEVKKLGILKDSLVVVDTSSSMNDPKFLPLDIAVALGIIISSVTEGEFKGHVITFNDVPKFVKITGNTLFDRFKQVKNIPWGGSTNLQATFDMILEKAELAKLKQSDMPKRLFIISDMQFNDIEGSYSKRSTNLEEIDKKYKKSGFKRPDIVFWNVNGVSTDFPATTKDDGTCLVSGASPAIIKSILKVKEFNSYSILREELDSERYKQVRELL